MEKSLENSGWVSVHFCWNAPQGCKNSNFRQCTLCRCLSQIFINSLYPRRTCWVSGWKSLSALFESQPRTSSVARLFALGERFGSAHNCAIILRLLFSHSTINIILSPYRHVNSHFVIHFWFHLPSHVVHISPELSEKKGKTLPLQWAEKLRKMHNVWWNVADYAPLGNFHSWGMTMHDAPADAGKFVYSIKVITRELFSLCRPRLNRRTMQWYRSRASLSFINI